MGRGASGTFYRAHQLRLGRDVAVKLVPVADAVPGTASRRDWPNLRRGSRGVKVEALQLLLTERGHATKVDGIYGAGTEKEVAIFQEQNRLRPTGAMDDRTFEKLLPRVSRGDRGDEVRAVQRLLGTTGHRVKVDGVFGARTQTAVRARQAETGLTRDGVVGPRTWFTLMWRDARIDDC